MLRRWAALICLLGGCGGRPLLVGTTEPSTTAPITACVTLTVAFAGCDAERLAECEREYRALSASAEGLIDADGTCFRASAFYASQLNTTWPATPGSCRAALPVWNNWYHGGCQGDNGAVQAAVAAQTSALSFCGSSGQPVCFFTGTLAP